MEQKPKRDAQNHARPFLRFSRKSKQGALIASYRAAAARASGADERAFFLTQAYILALEDNDACAPECHKALKALGREQ